MSVTRTQTPLVAMAEFVVSAEPPAAARERAAAAVLDTVGVTLAGATEPAARSVHATITSGRGPCLVLGTGLRTSATDAALANGTAAHALDFDDMCFVSLAHPSAPLVPAILATSDVAGASGRAALASYVVGFEIETRLGALMNPRHYDRGWHCTSTLGVIGAAAAASRLLGLDATQAAHALGIAASAASGVKENFGSMVKPLHAGLAARDGVLAALLARAGLTASARALDGPQGFLHAMDSEGEDLASAIRDLGSRWEILDTGITMKLYPSCAATHPPLDALLDLRAEEGLTPESIESIDVDVDRVTPTVLLYNRPTNPLEAKFSMSFCAAAALADGRVGIDTFADDRLRDPALLALMTRVNMGVDEALGRTAPPLTEARVHVRLRGGRTLVREVRGARGYPERPASAAEVEAKFMACATRVLAPGRASRALEILRRFEDLADVRELMQSLT
ncbi:MAG TPA: MmgE/PrpD family protein [Vicinamibacterales bacterium]|nr:MmgE/PrpD family protein [Vicinamibacterales bacterium]